MLPHQGRRVTTAVLARAARGGALRAVLARQSGLRAAEGHARPEANRIRLGQEAFRGSDRRSKLFPMSPVLRGVFPSALAVVATACVVGAERRPSRLDVARAPDESAEQPGSVSGAEPCAPPPQKRRPPAKAAGAVWIDGYCHWNGARYVWVDGYWDVGSTLRNRAGTHAD